MTFRSSLRWLVALAVVAAWAPAPAAQSDARVGPSAFINEFHYDNASSDVDEFIEIAVPSGTDVNDLVITLYNGSDSEIYNTNPTIAGSSLTAGATAGSFTLHSIVLPSNGLQNGSADGIALSVVGGALLDFISYEGTLTASGGPADGVTSTDVGVSETSSTPVGSSLQLTGPGSSRDDFTWTGPIPHTRGAVNTGQSFGGPPPPPPVDATIAEARAFEPGTTVRITGTVSRAEGDFTYFQDGTAGLAIRQTSGDFADDVANNTIRPGTQLEVVGRISESQSFLQISGGGLDEYTIEGYTSAPSAQRVTLRELTFNGEDYESELVEVTRIQIPGAPRRFEAATTYVPDDGSTPGRPVTLRVPDADDTTVDGTQIPSQATYVGPVGQSSSDPDNGYQLLLIDPADITSETFVPRPTVVAPIADARAAGDGTVVTVEGVVTRAAGNLLYIQDETGGLAIRQTSGDLNAAVASGAVAPGTVLQVMGTLSTFRGLLQINEADLTDFEVTGTADVPAPQVVTRAQFSADGEAYESELIRIVSATITPDGDTVFSASSNYAFADGTGGDAELRVPSAGDTVIDGLTIPTAATTLTGIASQFSSSGSGGYQLLVIAEGDVADAGSGGGGGGGDAVTIAEARAAGPGATVTIEGTVSRGQGAFLYVQDDTAGLTLRQTSGDLFDALASGAVGPGTVLRITGTLSEFRELLQINGSDLESFEVTGTGDAPEAQTVTLAELAANGEAYEAELVRVEGVTLETASTLTGAPTFAAGTDYTASDGTAGSGVVLVRVPNANDSTADGEAIPARADYVGVVGQFNRDGEADQGYQVLLIEASDITAIGGVATEDAPEGALAIALANPVRGAATVTFSAPSGTARLAVYDALGRQVAVLADGPVAGTEQTVTFDAGALAPGVYVLHLRSNAGAASRTVTVIR